jgi:peptidyl-prolyl cis-trans isomerase C
MRALIEREVVTPEPGEAECRRFYDHNTRRFRSRDLYEAAHILIAASPDDKAARTRARATATAIETALASDVSLFADFARGQSDCKESGESGGHLGQFARGETTPELEAALDVMAPGDIALVESRYGLHVVRLDHRATGATLPFEAVRQRIADYLKASVTHRALAQYVAILAGRAEITGITLAAATPSPLVQ